MNMFSTIVSMMTNIKTSILPSVLLESKKMFLAQVIVSVMEQIPVILQWIVNRAVVRGG